MPTRHKPSSIIFAVLAYDHGMNDLVINVSWEYFLGMVGTLMAIGYYANGRFTRLETNFQWMADALRDLTIKAENISTKVFNADSPISLTPAGRRLLERSGLKSYIDARRDLLAAQLRLSEPHDLYRVQACAFRLFAGISFDDTFAQRLSKFAFSNGISTDLLRRVGAIYFRDVAVARK